MDAPALDDLRFPVGRFRMPSRAEGREREEWIGEIAGLPKAMRAAVSRTTGRGTVLGAGECVPARAALEMFFGAADAPEVQRRIAPGQPGDLCILGASPTEVLEQLDASLVAATVIAGRVAFER